MTLRTWQFEAADSLFFGSGKPMNAGESSWIDSQFPPTGLTLQGAIRTAVLFHTKADIAAFTDGKPCLQGGGSLKAEIGDARSLGALELTGPFLCLDGEVFFPAPLDLVGKAQEHALLTPSDETISCDLGNIRLPVVKNQPPPGSAVILTANRQPDAGVTPALPENCYLTRQDMEKLLNDDTDGITLMPLFGDSAEHKALADKEPKIGLARDNKTRGNLESMLFAIAPVRPRPGLSLQVRVSGIKPEHLPDKTVLQKLGGEGKLASIQVSQMLIKMPESRIAPQGDKIRFKLVFTQPALMPVKGWLPEGFSQTENKDAWTGLLTHCPVTLISACIGKMVKLGGWDLIQHSSKNHQAYIPAGSVYFFEARATDLEQIKKLHDSKLGLNCQYGFGHVLLGRW